MLTSEEWAAKLAEAYKEYKGTDIELGDYKNAGYKWVAEFIANANFSINSRHHDGQAKSARLKAPATSVCSCFPNCVTTP